MHTGLAVVPNYMGSPLRFFRVTRAITFLCCCCPNAIAIIAREHATLRAFKKLVGRHQALREFSSIQVHKRRTTFYFEFRDAGIGFVDDGLLGL